MSHDPATGQGEGGYIRYVSYISSPSFQVKIAIASKTVMAPKNKKITIVCLDS